MDAGGNVTTVSIKPPGASAAQTLVSHIDHAPFGPMTAWTYGDSAGTVVTRTRNLDKADPATTNVTPTSSTLAAGREVRLWPGALLHGDTNDGWQPADT